MSCSVVDPESMDHIVLWISRQTEWFAGIKAELNTTGKPENWNKIGRLLYKMNCDAYYTRYPGEKVARAPEGQRIEDLYEFRYRPQPSEIQMYKHLHCFLYQCKESDEIEARREFVELDEMFYRLGRHIVEHLPEYNAAKWA